MDTKKEMLHGGKLARHQGGKISRTRRLLSGLAVSTVLLTGLWSCSSDDPSPVVTVMGDSLSDVGSFGFKATIQDAANPRGYPLWTQLIANVYGADGTAQCSYFLATTNGSFNPNPNVSCSNFAIGGGRVVAGASLGGPTSPLTIGTQMARRAALGSFSPNELVLVDGGGNDVADLVGFYLGAAGSQTGQSAYQQFLAQQLDNTTIATLLVQSNGPALAAGAYMQKLADTFFGQISAQLLEKGAQRIVILNVPDITLTPRFKAVLLGVTAQAGPAAAQQLQGAIRQWVAAFNMQLAARAAAEPRILVVDFNGTFSDIVQNFSNTKYALTNATDSSCPIVGLGSDGLPSYDFPKCTSQALDTTPGKQAGWWKTYLFSDGFHPSPRGHELMAQAVRERLDAKGWTNR
jgi:outer membrane lipase/esterase